MGSNENPTPPKIELNKNLKEDGKVGITESIALNNHLIKRIFWYDNESDYCNWVMDLMTYMALRNNSPGTTSPTKSTGGRERCSAAGESLPQLNLPPL